MKNHRDMENNRTILPEKLSDCIDVAMRDLEAVINDKNYIVNFDHWHEVLNDNNNSQFDTSDERCSVCFAGSVMAKSLDGDFSINLTPDNFPKERKKLMALDKLRKGDIYGALKNIQVYDESIKQSIDVNQHDYEEFKKDMEIVKQELIKYGY